VRVEWHPLAVSDLAELVTYIAADNPSAAYRVHDDLRNQTDRLVQFPEMGRPGRIPGTRELVVADTPYIAVYRIKGELMTILRVLHGARRWPRKL
jgi:toxin ParE1/3/4